LAHFAAGSRLCSWRSSLWGLFCIAYNLNLGTAILFASFPGIVGGHRFFLAQTDGPNLIFGYIMIGYQITNYFLGTALAEIIVYCSSPMLSVLP